MFQSRVNLLLKLSLYYGASGLKVTILDHKLGTVKAKFCCVFVINYKPLVTYVNTESSVVSKEAMFPLKNFLCSPIFFIIFLTPS